LINILNEYDRLQVENIYTKSNVNIYHKPVKILIKDIIRELYISGKFEILELEMHHLDRAIWKFRKAFSEKEIKNTKQYFKACIVSAINEAELEIPFE